MTGPASRTRRLTQAAPAVEAPSAAPADAEPPEPQALESDPQAEGASPSGFWRRTLRYLLPPPGAAEAFGHFR
jgi:hypothetical protein